MLVDPYEYAPGSYFDNFQHRPVLEAVGGADRLWERLRPFRNRTVVVTQPSLGAAAWVAPGSLDLVFLDGDHTYDAVKEDIAAWLPKVRRGGVLAGHDYSLHCFGVIQAVHELSGALGAAPLYLGLDHMWWIWL